MRLDRGVPLVITIGSLRPKPCDVCRRGRVDLDKPAEPLEICGVKGEGWWGRI